MNLRVIHILQISAQLSFSDRSPAGVDGYLLKFSGDKLASGPAPSA